MKLLHILLEQNQDQSSPKAIIMAGGAGAGKSYLAKRLQLGSLPTVNPDKYVEDPNHPAHNNLNAATKLAGEDLTDHVANKRDFIWDTTASSVKFVKDLESLLNKGYQVYMVMAYTHPMISYISNFERGRKIPAIGVMDTWKKAYERIKQYDDMLGGNFSLFVNDRDGKYDKRVQEFNDAAKQGPEGLKKYIDKYNSETGAGRSTFFQPVEMSQEEEQAFNKAIQGVDYNRDDRSEDKAVKLAFLKTFQKKGLPPKQGELEIAAKKYRDEKQSKDQKYLGILKEVGDMLQDPQFSELLQHSSIEEIDSKLQNFLA